MAAKGEFMRTIDELDDVLLEEYYFESSFKDCYTTYMPTSDEVSDMPELAELQSQYAYWCLKSKEKLCSDSLPNETPDSNFVLLIKDHISSYKANPANQINPAMKWLYSLTDMTMLSQQISMLAMHSQFKNQPDISIIDEHTQWESLNPITVSIGIAIYTYYTILVNPSIKINTFNALFIRSRYCYYKNWMARCLMIRMNGSNWRLQFKGVLLE